jgi:hypothetical protein
MNIELLKKSGYFVKVKKIKNTLIIEYPDNIIKNHKKEKIYYTIKNHHIVKTKNVKKRFECPKYAAGACIILDIFFELQKRQLSTKLLILEDKEKLFKFQDILEKKEKNILEEKIFLCLQNIVAGDKPVVTPDIEDGFKCLIKVLELEEV